MANDNHSSFAKIGFIVIAGTAAIVASLIYIGGLKGNGPTTIFETYYDKGVSGLAVGSAVNMRGVKIGEVSEVSFIGCKYGVTGVDSARIYIRMSIDREKLSLDPKLDMSKEFIRKRVALLVDNGLRATISSSGITGLSHIEMDFYPPEKATPIEKICWDPEDVFVPPQISLLDNFSDSATKVMNQINHMDLNLVFSNFSASVDAIAKASDTLKQMMEVRQSDLEKLCDDLTDVSSSIKETAAEIRRNPSLILRNRELAPLPETKK